jgi:hypothetical protein
MILAGHFQPLARAGNNLAAGVRPFVDTGKDATCPLSETLMLAVRLIGARTIGYLVYPQA